MHNQTHVLRLILGLKYRTVFRYGNNLTKPKTMDGSAYDLKNLVVFDQSAYWINATHPELKNANLPPDGSGGTSDKA